MLPDIKRKKCRAVKQRSEDIHHGCIETIRCQQQHAIIRANVKAVGVVADMVEDVTDRSARIAGHSLLEDDEAAIAQEREVLIETLIRERQVPRPIAVIMADKGYSKGTAFRIFNDAARRKQADREIELGITA